MKRNFIIGSMLLLSLASISCGRQQSVPAINPENFDLSVAPGEDFYKYATGGWQKNNPLRPEFSRYGSFDVLAENNEIRLNELFKSLATSKAKFGTEAQKIADLYTMGLDSLRLNEEGATPVLTYLRQLEDVKDLESFAYATAIMANSGCTSLYGTYVSADLMDSNVNVLYLGEDGLAMSNRDYYLLEEHAALREGYRDFLEKIFTIAGFGDPKQIADDAFEVEMAIAVPFWSMASQRDVAAQYNPMTPQEIFDAYPNLHLDTYLREYGIPPIDKIIVEQKSYFEALDKILASTDPVKLKHYLQASVLSEACGALSDDFYSASFDFFSKQMSGTQEQKPRWKRAMALPNSALGEAVGKLYVEKFFPEKDKERMLSIVRNIQASLSEHIDSLDWMSDETKAKAQEKLATFTVKIGYPDKWKDYSSLQIDPKLSYFENCLRVARWYTRDDKNKLGKPVDREEWYMSPQTVNAYYSSSTNEICFPAGILQPPFFFPDADDAVNYGAIGVVISHEMTHGFDDQGRLFDKDGNMVNWWTDADAENFKARTDVLVDQFNKVEVLPGVYANGEATLGENIADQGGLRIAYTAMQNSFKGNHPGLVDGFTAEQRFYIAYATVWAQNITNEEIQKRTLLDVHSIGENRVNVSVRNLDTFFKAFDIKEGDRMYRPEEERVVIW